MNATEALIMKHLPPCDRPGEPCRIGFCGIRQTMIGWKQTYNRAGVPQQVDPNTQSCLVQCEACLRTWGCKVRGGQVSVEEMPAAQAADWR